MRRHVTRDSLIRLAEGAVPLTLLGRQTLPPGRAAYPYNWGEFSGKGSDPQKLVDHITGRGKGR